MIRRGLQSSAASCAPFAGKVAFLLVVLSRLLCTLPALAEQQQPPAAPMLHPRRPALAAGPPAILNVSIWPPLL